MNPNQYSPDEWKAMICGEEFVSVKEAKNIAFGSIKNENISLLRYYSAWQYIYDKCIPLSEADYYYMEKLLCDGVLVER